MRKEPPKKHPKKIPRNSPDDDDDDDVADEKEGEMYDTGEYEGFKGEYIIRI